jgi:hypothetical protein
LQVAAASIAAIRFASAFASRFLTKSGRFRKTPVTARQMSQNTKAAPMKASSACTACPGPG